MNRFFDMTTSPPRPLLTTHFIRTHTHTHQYTHIHTNIYTYIHTHTDTHIQEYTSFNAHCLNSPSLLRHPSRSHYPECEQSGWGGRARRQMAAPPSLPESQQYVPKTCDWFYGWMGVEATEFGLKGLWDCGADTHCCLRDGVRKYVCTHALCVCM